jgi:hypothetical protein
VNPALRLEHHPIAVESEDTVCAMLDLAVPDAPGDEQRPRLDLALVIDRSG